MQILKGHADCLTTVSMDKKSHFWTTQARWARTCYSVYSSDLCLDLDQLVSCDMHGMPLDDFHVLKFHDTTADRADV